MELDAVIVNSHPASLILLPPNKSPHQTQLPTCLLISCSLAAWCFFFFPDTTASVSKFRIMIYSCIHRYASDFLYTTSYSTLVVKLFNRGEKVLQSQEAKFSFFDCAHTHTQRAQPDLMIPWLSVWTLAAYWHIKQNDKTRPGCIIGREQHQSRI